MSIELYIFPEQTFATKIESDIFRGSILYDIMVGPIYIRNKSSSSISVQEMLVTIMDEVGNKDIRTIPPESIIEQSKQLKVFFNSDSFKHYDSVLKISDRVGLGMTVVDSPEINENETLVAPKSYFLLKFLPTKMAVELVYTIDDNEIPQNATMEALISLIEQKNEYIFPLKGTYLIGSSITPFTHHRWAEGNAFAIDVLKVHPDSGRHYAGDIMVLENHPCFGDPVYACADGQVIEISDGEMDEYESISRNEGESDHEFAVRSLQIRGNRNTERIQNDELPVLNQANFVRVEHINGETSYYVHLKNGSITVKVGDQVKQGQKLGEIGNSGNSLSPHLHFSLHASPERLSPTIPVKFSNLKNRYLALLKGQPLTGDVVTTD